MKKLYHFLSTINKMGIKLAVLFLLLPKPGNSEILPNSPSNQSDSIKRKTYIQHTYSNGVSKYSIKQRGEIELTEDEKDIKNISPGGYLKIEKTTFGNKRRLEITSDSRGEVHKKYFENRKELPFESEGKNWLSEILLEVIRSSGIDAENRVNRIYKKGKTSAVLREISLITSNSVKGDYFDYLLEKNDLNDQELIQIVEKIGSSITSNSTRAELLEDHSRVFLDNDKKAKAFFAVLSKLSSNTERGEVLRHIVDDHKLSHSMYIDLLKATGKLSSNYERAEVLEEVNEIFIDKPQAYEAYFRVIDGMSSNTERGNVLTDLLEDNNLSAGCLKRLLESTRKISSNTEKGNILEEFIPYFENDKSLIPVFFQTINSVSSNTEKGNILRSLIYENDLKAEAQLELFKSAKALESNTEKGQVLALAMKRMSLNEQAHLALFDAINSLHSNTEKGRLLDHYVNSTQLRGDHNHLFFETVQSISSSHDKAQILKETAQYIPSNDQNSIHNYLETVETIRGSFEQGEALIELIEEVELNKNSLISVLKTTKFIGNNNEKAEILIKVSGLIEEGDKELKEAFKDAASSLSSNYDYRRVMERL
ncbi:hypothetical protein [Xanthovirga aplysinae]|uniref:hypothetical protein n=1 Tax=Xanthovirga aplysinae TaxID=2529853 RepID=UPI0012BCAB0A|nr:hypothetical protein [Xanthovirga aplysinae]MTI33466.1 hypothetical protein [Xanthovirga aplysinae]